MFAAFGPTPARLPISSVFHFPSTCITASSSLLEIASERTPNTFVSLPDSLALFIASDEITESVTSTSVFSGTGAASVFSGTATSVFLGARAFTFLLNDSNLLRFKSSISSGFVLNHSSPRVLLAKAMAFWRILVISCLPSTCSLGSAATSAVGSGAGVGLSASAIPFVNALALNVVPFTIFAKSWYASCSTQSLPSSASAFDMACSTPRVGVFGVHG